MTITSRVLPDFAKILHDFHSDFTRFSKFNNFFNFEARDLLDHLNESLGSPLSYSANYRGLSSVEQKIGRGRKLGKMRKWLKSVDRRIGKIAKKIS